MKVNYADYDKDGSFFGEEKSAITIENFERYKTKYGEERALGYLQAIRDFNDEFAIMRNEVENNRHRISPSYASDTIVGNSIRSFYYHNMRFLMSIDNPENISFENRNSDAPVV